MHRRTGNAHRPCAAASLPYLNRGVGGLLAQRARIFRPTPAVSRRRLCLARCARAPLRTRRLTVPDRLTGRAENRVRQTQIYKHTNRNLQIVWQQFLANFWFCFCVQSCPEFLLRLWREGADGHTDYEMNTARRSQNTCTWRPCDSVRPCSIT